MKTPTSPETPRPSRQPTGARRLGEALARQRKDGEPARILELATALLEDAVREDASDIHLDPVPEGHKVSFRIDGALVEALRLPRDEGLHLLRSFKSQAADDGFRSCEVRYGAGDF